MKKGRIVPIALAIVGLAAAAYAALGLQHNKTVADAFERVEPGQTRKDVLAMLGSPDATRS